MSGGVETSTIETKVPARLDRLPWSRSYIVSTDATAFSRELTVAAKFWGPGRFRTALREAIAEGRVVRGGRGMLGPPSEDPPR